MYYHHPTLLREAQGNAAIDFEQRQKLWSGRVLRIPTLVNQSWRELAWDREHIAYEYIDEQGLLVSDYGLQELIYDHYHTKDLYILDNHNHAFAMRWRSCLSWKIARWSQLIHIDQHSDLRSPGQSLHARSEISLSQIEGLFAGSDDDTSDLLWQIDRYTNEVLTIADFIKPAQEIWLIHDYEMLLTEYGLLHYDIWWALAHWSKDIILDIDLDFRAPEMSIAQYDQTIQQVRKLILHPHIKVITIATSPTYIAQTKVTWLLEDLLW